MKDVYLKNPQMGDPASLDHKLAEVSQNIEKLRLEAQKFEVGRSCCGKALLEKKEIEVGVGGHETHMVVNRHCFFPYERCSWKNQVSHEL